MRKVYINYSVLEKNGTDYLTYSDELETIDQEIRKILNEINTTWDSVSEIKDTFIADANIFEKSMKNDINYASRYGKTILKIKDNFKEKDTEYGKQFSNTVLEEEKKYAK